MSRHSSTESETRSFADSVLSGTEQLPRRSGRVQKTNAGRPHKTAHVPETTAPCRTEAVAVAVAEGPALARPQTHAPTMPS